MTSTVSRVVSRGRLRFALVTILALLLLALAGSVVAPAALRPSVPLLTGDGGTPGCYTFAVTGPLVADATYGTAIMAEQPGDPNYGPRTPVMWPKGYTARKNGGEVEVVGLGFLVVATTGQRYRLDGGYISAGFLACGDVARVTLPPGPCPGQWCTAAKEEAWRFLEVEHPEVDPDTTDLTLSAGSAPPVIPGTTVRFEATRVAFDGSSWTFAIDCGVRGKPFCTYVAGP